LPNYSSKTYTNGKQIFMPNWFLYAAVKGQEVTKGSSVSETGMSSLAKGRKQSFNFPSRSMGIIE